MSRLTIISHTEHYKKSDGTIVGLSSTVTEINHLIKVFDEIVHVAMLLDVDVPKSALAYESDNIKFVPIPAVGGMTFKDKMSIIVKAPLILKTIHKHLSKTDCFQFRAPTGIGVFVVPYLVFLSSKKGWFKYAGNWKQKHAPLAYAFQRKLLKSQKRLVTINGSWINQPKHCLTFENPCLSLGEIEYGNAIVKNKRYENNALNFCFVGRLEKEKGVNLFIKALKSLETRRKKKINRIDIVGFGKEIEAYKKMAEDKELNFVFHGLLSRSAVHEIYAKAHAIILPSRSEGFPKVIAEALNYGCVPIVSNVSGISYYIQDNVNGFLLESISVEATVKKIRSFLNLSREDYLKMITSRRQQIRKFTYSYYNSRVIKELIN